jgi:hypothetical protein
MPLSRQDVGDGIRPCRFSNHVRGEKQRGWIHRVAVLVAFGSILTTLLGGYAALRIGPYRYMVLGLSAVDRCLVRWASTCCQKH